VVVDGERIVRVAYIACHVNNHRKPAVATADGFVCDKGSHAFLSSELKRSGDSAVQKLVSMRKKSKRTEKSAR